MKSDSEHDGPVGAFALQRSIASLKWDRYVGVETHIERITFKRWFDATPRGFDWLYGYVIEHGFETIRVFPFTSKEDRDAWERLVTCVTDCDGVTGLRYAALLLMLADSDDMALAFQLLVELRYGLSQGAFE